MLLKVIFKPEVYVCENEFTNLLYIYNSHLFRTFPWNMGLIIGIPIFIFFLDVLDVNNEESIKNRSKSNPK